MSEERSFEELLKEESSVTIHNGAIVERDSYQRK